MTPSWPETALAEPEPGFGSRSLRVCRRALSRVLPLERGTRDLLPSSTRAESLSLARRPPSVWTRTCTVDRWIGGVARKGPTLSYVVRLRVDVGLYSELKTGHYLRANKAYGFSIAYIQG